MQIFNKERLGDNVDTSFKTVEELYNRVLPALRSKVKELKRENITYVKEQDIWNYLIDNKWKYSHGLELNQIVDDILNTSNHSISVYVQSMIRKMNREVKIDKSIL